jgi:hypothetical protein
MFYPSYFTQHKKTWMETWLQSHMAEHPGNKVRPHLLPTPQYIKGISAPKQSTHGS